MWLCLFFSAGVARTMAGKNPGAMHPCPLSSPPPLPRLDCRGVGRAPSERYQGRTHTTTKNHDGQFGEGCRAKLMNDFSQRKADEARLSHCIGSRQCLETGNTYAESEEAERDIAATRRCP